MKRYIVTGASSGVGKVCTKRLLKQGNQVIIVARNTAAIDELAKDYLENALIKECDLSIPGNAQKLIENLSEGNLMPIDGMVYCAGIAPLMKIEENTCDEVGKVFQINLFSFAELLESLKRTNVFRGGYSESCSVVAMSSVTAWRGSNRQSVYGATKAALIDMSKYYAEILREQGVRVNTIVSGAIRTEMLEKLKEESPGLEERLKKYYPLGVIPVNEICDIIEFLLSHKSMMLTGKSIPVDSGYLL